MYKMWGIVCRTFQAFCHMYSEGLLLLENLKRERHSRPLGVLSNRPTMMENGGKCTTLYGSMMLYAWAVGIEFLFLQLIYPNLRGGSSGIFPISVVYIDPEIFGFCGPEPLGMQPETSSNKELLTVDPSCMALSTTEPFGMCNWRTFVSHMKQTIRIYVVPECIRCWIRLTCTL